MTTKTTERPPPYLADLLRDDVLTMKWIANRLDTLSDDDCALFGEMEVGLSLIFVQEAERLQNNASRLTARLAKIAH